jgi:hypothetical protein
VRKISESGIGVTLGRVRLRPNRGLLRRLGKVAPEVGFEPTTNRLTADRSTTELLRSVVGQDTNRDLGRFKRKL